VASGAPAAPIEVVVRERRPLAPPTLEMRIGGEEGRRGAGTQGDTVKALQALPGLARSGAGAGEVVAWGSAPRETRVYVDGVELPALYHGSGVRSVLPSGWIARLGFVPGAYGADHGRGLGGLVTLETRALDHERFHASAQLDPLDAAVSASIPLNSSVALAVAGRHGWLDRVLSVTSERGARDLLAVPRYSDWQGKLDADLGVGERLELVHLGARDHLSRIIPSSDATAAGEEQRELSFERWYLRYRREAGGDTLEITPFIGVDDSLLRQSATTARASLGVHAVPFGLRASQALELSAQLRVRLGVDARGASSHVEREGSLTVPAREGDPYVFGQLPGSDHASDHLDTLLLDVAPYAELDWTAGPVTLSPGLRLDTVLLESDRVRPPVGRVPAVGRSRARAAPEPRLAVTLDLDARVRLLAAAGIYHQAPDCQDLSATFGNPELGIARALHLTLGEQVRFTPALSLELLGFYKTLDDLAVRSPLPTPDSARVLLSSGSGRSLGVQLTLRQTLSAGWSGWLATTLSRSEREQAGEPPRLFDYDQPLVLAAVVNKRLERWSFGARLRVASGSPRTPVIGASYNLRTARYEPLFGPANSTRLPDFLQLDVRVDREFALGEEARLSVYLDALNVTARDNAEELVYSADYREHGYLLGLPPLLVLGARIER
jgi:hypothetical protein